MRRKMTTIFIVAVTFLTLVSCSNIQPASVSTVTASTPSGPITTTNPPEPLQLFKSCSEVLSTQKLYDFNPNLAITTSQIMTPGTQEESVQKAGGLTCSLLNLSSSQKINVSFLKISKSEEQSAIAEVSISSSPATLAIAPKPTCYFRTLKNIGELNCFVNGYWVNLVSPTYLVAEDATKLFKFLLETLP